MTPFRHLIWLRWLARIWAGVSAFGIALIFGWELNVYGWTGLLGLELAEALTMASLAIQGLGLALGWHHERIGGWMVVAGLASFYLVSLAATGTVPVGPWFLALAAPGFLYLYCARAERLGATAARPPARG